jgi:tetratricopeptide (TPR) repeat protein
MLTLDSTPPTDAREVVDRDLLGSLLPPARHASASPPSSDALFHAISIPPPPPPLDPAVFALEDPHAHPNEPAPEAVLAEDRAAIPSMAPPPGAAADVLQAAIRHARPVRKPSTTRLVALAHQAAAQGDHAGAARVLAMANKVQPVGEDLARHEREAVQRAAKRADERPGSAEDLERHVEAAKQHEGDKQWEEAAASWSAAQRIAPHDEAIRKRASISFARAAQAVVRSGGALPRALELSRAAVAMCSDNVAAHVIMAQVFLTGGLKTSARRALETALELDPKSEPARALLAKI